MEETDRAWTRYYDLIGTVFLQDFYDKLSERWKMNVERESTKSIMEEMMRVLSSYVNTTRGDREVVGDLAYLFNRPTNVVIDNEYTVFNLAAYYSDDASDSRLPIMMFAVFSLVKLYLNMSSKDKTRIFVFDEIQNILKYESVTRLVFAAFTTYRNKSAGMWIATQNIQTILGSQSASTSPEQRRAYANTMIQNCPRIFFLKHKSTMFLKEFFDKEPIPDVHLKFIKDVAGVRKDSETGLPTSIACLLQENKEFIPIETIILPNELKNDYAINQGALGHQQKLREAQTNNY